MTVGQRVIDERTSVEVQLTLGRETELRASSSGILTELKIKAASQPKEGEVAFSIDGVDVVVDRSATPLYRELTVGARGPDVRSYGELLATMGFLSTPDDVFGPQYHEATRLLQKRIHAPVDGVFRPEYVVFVSTTAPPISEVLAHVGDPVTAGQAIARISPSVEGARFETPEGAAPLTTLKDEKVVLLAGSSSLELENIQSLDEEAQIEIAEFLSSSVAAGEIPKSAVKESDGTRVYSQIFVELAQPRVFGTVPATSIVTSPTGVTCVIVGDDVTQVEVTASTEPGLAYIDASMVGESVLTSPTASERGRCE